MLTKEQIEIRRPIWKELSDFYLDSEPSEEDIIRAAKVFKASGLSLQEIKEINYTEVAPVFSWNGIYGEWPGFPEEGVSTVLEILSRKTYSEKTDFFSKIGKYLDRKRIDFYSNRYFKKIRIEIEKV